MAEVKCRRECSHCTEYFFNENKTDLWDACLSSLFWGLSLYTSGGPWGSTKVSAAPVFFFFYQFWNQEKYKNFAKRLQKFWVVSCNVILASFWRPTGNLRSSGIPNISMSENSLSGLALMKVHSNLCNIKLVFDSSKMGELVKSFEQLHPRKMKLSFVLADDWLAYNEIR